MTFNVLCINDFIVVVHLVVVGITSSPSFTGSIMYSTVFKQRVKQSDMVRANCSEPRNISIVMPKCKLCWYTVCLKKVHILFFFNNSGKNQPILIIFGTENSVEISRVLQNCSSDLKISLHYLAKSNKSFSTKITLGIRSRNWASSQSMKLRLFFHQWDTAHYGCPMNIQSYLVVWQWQPKSATYALATSHPCIPSHFQQIQNGLNSSRAKWIMPSIVVKITCCVSTQKMQTFYTIPVALLVWNLSCHVTKQLAV